MISRNIIIFGALWFFLLPAPEAVATRLSPNDFQKGQTAFAAAKTGDWTKVRQLGNEIHDPTLRKLLTWADLIRSTPDIPFMERASFILENPDWPWQRRLRRLAEQSIPPEMKPEAVIAWFDRFEPLSKEGRLRWGAALLSVGDVARGGDVIRNTWIEEDLSASEEQDFVQRYGQLLTGDTHLRRLDRLLWNGDRKQSVRMFPRVGTSDRLAAEARLRLRAMAPDAPAAFSRVPAARRSDEGVVYEWLRWQRRKEMNDAARATLRTYPQGYAHPRLWWRERSILARRALAAGNVTATYTIVNDHGLTDGAAFADAEWMSGWIALRFLNQPTLAAKHFDSMYRSVKFPISRARGAYWRARAAESMDDQPLAARWYETAANHPTTFYGQLATLKRPGGGNLQLAAHRIPPAENAGAFNNHELIQAVQILAAYGQSNRLRPFVLRVGEVKDSMSWQTQAAALAGAYGQHDLAIAIAKMAAKSDRLLLNSGYPIVPVPKPPGSVRDMLEVPLVLAIVRQESAYRADAVSPAGARGLMQLLPSTARQVARAMNVPYSSGRLTTDPSYNLKLGQAYMSKMLQRFSGSYILALAAYNAGPERVAEWTGTHGRPRAELLPAIDWIERIPHAETRNYVQRILESLQIYRVYFNRSEAGVTIVDDLTR